MAESEDLANSLHNGGDQSMPDSTDTASSPDQADISSTCTALAALSPSNADSPNTSGDHHIDTECTADGTAAAEGIADSETSLKVPCSSAESTSDQELHTSSALNTTTSSSSDHEGCIASSIDSSSRKVCDTSSRQSDIQPSDTDSGAGTMGPGGDNDEMSVDATVRVSNAVKRRRHTSGSDDDDDASGDNNADNNEKDEEENDTESEEDVDFEPVVGEPVPHQIHTDILRREYGYKVKISPWNFTEAMSANLSFVQRLELQYKLDQHNGCVNALHFNQSGNLLASGSDDLKVILWDWCHMRDMLVYESGHKNNVFQAKFLPFSGDLLMVTCARDGQVRLGELSTTGVCRSTKKLAQHKGAAHKLALEMDSPHVFLSCGEDAVTYQIDIREEKPNKLVVTKEESKNIPTYSIHSNPFNAYEFCVAGRDKYVRIYDKRKIAQDSAENTLRRYCPHHMIGVNDNKCNVTCAVYNDNGTQVLSSYNDEDIYLFDTSHSDGADHIKKYHGHRNNATVKGVNFYGPKSEYIISGSDCGNIYIWEKESEKVVQFFPGDEGGVVNVLEPHPFGPFLATSGLDSDVKIWAPTSKAPSEMGDLGATMKKNRKERRDDLNTEPDMLDGQAVWLLMQHLRRSVRRRQRDAMADGSDSNDDDDDSSNSESDDSDAVADQCSPS